MWQAGELDKLAAMLAVYEKPGDYDPRGFEWHYWRSVCKPQHVFEHTSADGHFTEVTFDPEGRRLAAIDGGKVIVWDIQTGQELYRLGEPAECGDVHAGWEAIDRDAHGRGRDGAATFDAENGHKIADMGEGKFALNPNRSGIVIEGNYGKISSFFSFPDGKYQVR